MVFFDKIAQFFKKQPLEAPAPVVPNGAQPSRPAVKTPSHPAVSPVPAPDTSALSLKDLFLEELRSIPVRHSAAETAREDIVRELKRLSPTDEGRSK